MEPGEQPVPNCKRCGVPMDLIFSRPREGTRPWSKGFQCKKCGLFDSIMGEVDVELLRQQPFDVSAERIETKELFQV
jgi:hypothetical protein